VSDQPLGPGWWQASDGKFYPPQGPGYSVPVYQTNRNQNAAYGVVGGCLLGVLIFVGVIAGLMLLGYALKP
jgi:hypothetical protein